MKFYDRENEIRELQSLDRITKMSEVRRGAFAALLIACVFMGCNNVAGKQDDKALFSVSTTKRVEFSPGNLAEDGRSFVAHQWEYGWLFGWGTGDRPADTTDDWQAYIRFVDWGRYVEGGWRTLTAEE